MGRVEKNASIHPRLKASHGCVGSGALNHVRTRNGAHVMWRHSHRRRLVYAAPGGGREQCSGRLPERGRRHRTCGMQRGDQSRSKRCRGLPGRGSAYVRRGENERAIADYNTAIKISPEFGLPYFNRGLVLESKNQLKEALSDFKRAAELDPTDDDSKAAVARVTAALARGPAPVSSTNGSAPASARKGSAPTWANRTSAPAAKTQALRRLSLRANRRCRPSAARPRNLADPRYCADRIGFGEQRSRVRPGGRRGLAGRGNAGARACQQIGALDLQRLCHHQLDFRAPTPGSRPPTRPAKPASRRRLRSASRPPIPSSKRRNIGTIRWRSPTADR